MLIIPAIDIRDGNCVMLTQGRLDAETIYSNDPANLAKIWQEKGAKRLHVVDLDGAFQGSPKNFDVLKKIRANITIPLEFGGGVRSMQTINLLAEAGVDHIIIGTVAVNDPELLRQAVDKHGSKIVVALDVRDNLVATAGWKETSTVDVFELAGRLKQLGIEEIIHTDIKKDGMMQGANIAALKEIAERSKLKVIASGGVSTLTDVEQLKALESTGIFGAIIGKALYNNSIKIEDAIKIAEK
jgi:phosphoribosylformimino-5-aminoimidazole carboxamide ribotide isomerase